MTPEEQRIAIAEACGWHSFRNIGGDSETRLWGMPIEMKPTTLPTQLVPDYLNDLNAMHEAEKKLKAEQKPEYVWNLYRICTGAEYDAMNFETFFATAAQRAEAFLRTTGKRVD